MIVLYLKSLVLEKTSENFHLVKTITSNVELRKNKESVKNNKTEKYIKKRIYSKYFIEENVWILEVRVECLISKVRLDFFLKRQKMGLNVKKRNITFYVTLWIEGEKASSMENSHMKKVCFEKFIFCLYVVN